jgi:hypothetical protein
VEGGKRVFRIPASRRLRVRDSIDYGAFAKDEFYFMGEYRSPIPEQRPGHSPRPFGEHVSPHEARQMICPQNRVRIPRLPAAEPPAVRRWSVKLLSPQCYRTGCGISSINGKRPLTSTSSVTFIRL